MIATIISELFMRNLVLYDSETAYGDIELGFDTVRP